MAVFDLGVLLRARNVSWDNGTTEATTVPTTAPPDTGTDDWPIVINAGNADDSSVNWRGYIDPAAASSWGTSFGSIVSGVQVSASGPSLRSLHFSQAISGGSGSPEVWCYMESPGDWTTWTEDGRALYINGTRVFGMGSDEPLRLYCLYFAPYTQWFWGRGSYPPFDETPLYDMTSGSNYTIEVRDET